MHFLLFAREIFNDFYFGFRLSILKVMPRRCNSVGLEGRPICLSLKVSVARCLLAFSCGLARYCPINPIRTLLKCLQIYKNFSFPALGNPLSPSPTSQQLSSLPYPSSPLTDESSIPSVSEYTLANSEPNWQ
jgi:hypothetical protein